MKFENFSGFVPFVLEKSLVDIGAKLFWYLLGEGLEVSPQVASFICQAQFFPDIAPVKGHGFGGYVEHGGNLFAGLAVFDHIGNLEFRRC